MSTPSTGFAKRLQSIRQGLLKPVEPPHWAVDQAEGVIIHGHANKYVVRTPAGRTHYLELMNDVRREDMNLVPVVRRAAGLRMVAPQLSLPAGASILATQQDAALNFHAYRAGLVGWRLRIQELHSDRYKLLVEPVTHPDDPAVLLDSAQPGVAVVQSKNAGGRTVPLHECLSGIAHPGEGSPAFLNALRSILEAYRADEDADPLHSTPAPVPVTAAASAILPIAAKKRWFARG